MLLIGSLVILAHVAGPSEPHRSRPECVALTVSSPQQKPRSRPQERFSAARILDLRLHTVVRRPPAGSHQLEFKVFTPRGHLYQTLTVPFAAAERGRNHRPAPPRAQEVGVTLPVGGTAITTNSLYGTWRVEPVLDGHPCGKPERFLIAP